MSNRLPWYVPLMFVLTGIYLTVEVPFASYLSLILGGDATASDIQDVDRFGRSLSGIAAGLAIVGMWYFPRAHRMHVSRTRACISAMIVAATAASATYIAIGAYPDFRAHMSDGEERKSALIATLAKRSLISSDLHEELGLNAAQWNGFLAVMPELVGMENTVTMSGRSAAQLASLAGDDARRALGTVQEMKQDFFQTRFSAGERAYAAYEEALREAKAAYANADEEADSAWRTYASEMDKKFPDGWPSRPGWSRAGVVRKVKFTYKIPVPDNWNIRDKATFKSAVKKKVVDEITTRYQQAVEAELGSGVVLKPGLSYEQFLAVPAVQSKIRDNLRGFAVPAKLVIAPGMSDRDFQNAFHTPQIEKAVEEMREAIAADPSDYEWGGLAERGKDAVKAAILPALALMMSLIGAIVHIYKFTGYGVQIASHVLRIRPFQNGFARHVLAAAIVAIAGMQTMGLTHASFSSPEIARISSEGAYPAVLAATVMMQPQLAEIGGKLEKVGLFEAVTGHLPSPRAPAASHAVETDAVALNIPVPIPRPVH